jgi:protease I
MGIPRYKGYVSIKAIVCKGGTTMKTNKILVLVHDGAEDLELWYPVYRIREEGYLVHMASEKRGMLFKGKYGVPYVSDVSWDDVEAADYDGLLIPGGWAPDKMRRFERVKKLVRDFDASEKPIGQICHAGWVTISAGIMDGVKVTSTIGIKDDMENAGATWINDPVVVDDNIVSSRKPEDLTQYMVAFIDLLKK